jgi:hypothetical protein
MLRRLAWGLWGCVARRLPSLLTYDPGEKWWFVSDETRGRVQLAKDVEVEQWQ